MDRLTSMQVFVEVADSGGFSRASEHLGVSRAAVSKHVMQLETYLGARLLNRTTRRVSLTEVGRTYLAHCKSILADIVEAEACAGEASGRVAGNLRVNAPVSYGTRHLGPAIAAFCAAQNAVRVELDLNDRLIDVVEEGYDVVIRIAQLEDSSLVARRIASCRTVLCASRTYLEQHGTPSEPQDLARHRCLCYTNLPTQDTWEMSGPEGLETVRVSGPVRSNNGDILRTCALESLGIALQPTFIVGTDIADGRLAQVLPAYSSPELGIHAVYPSRRHLSRKVRAFVDFISDYFADRPF